VAEERIDHVPVLVGPVMELLAPQAGETVVDCTLGHGGHAALLGAAVGPTGRLIGLDVDPANFARARARLDAPELSGRLPPRDLLRANFTELESVLHSLGVERVDVILADLGVSTDQLLDPARGFTFSEDAPLDMRLDDSLERSASDLVNALSENELSDLIFFNSQERFSRRIAKRICQARREGRIRRTSELVRIVCSALGTYEESHPGRIHPATRTFLALRMAVNRELDNLQALLEAAPRRLRPGGRIGVISFHSGEDRIVKQNFLDNKRTGVYGLRTKKPVGPTNDEIRQNPRSRSAKLRVAERLAESMSAA
jgi:16S rRNA (cytosine1402-N4)-methyltransferase